MLRNLSDGELKFWQREILAIECKIRICSEFNGSDVPLPPKKPTMILSQGSVITVTGGTSSTFFIRLGPSQERKIAIPKTQLSKIKVL